MIKTVCAVVRFASAVCLGCAGMQPVFAMSIPPAPYLSLTTVAVGFQDAVAMASPADGTDRLFVAERTGAIRVVKNGALLTAPFLDLRGQVKLSGEASVLGLAFDPSYAARRRVFVSYVRISDGAIRVSSFLASDTNPDVADAATEAEVITIPHPDSNRHYGGAIAFAHDGTLFLSTGDGGTDGRPAQDSMSLLGKLLRIDVSTPSGYAVPANNYYAATSDPDARWEIVARGLADPRSFSFDRETGDLYLPDYMDGLSEINTLPADWWRSHAANFGWPLWSGDACVAPPNCPAADPPQRTEWGRPASGFVYRGLKSAALQGYYLHGSPHYSYMMGSVHDGASWYTPLVRANEPAGTGILAFGEDEAGEMYYVTTGGLLIAIHGPPPAVPSSTATAYQPNRHVDYDGNGKGDVTFATLAAAPAIQYGAWLMDPPAIKASAPITLGDASWRLWDIGDFDGNGRTDRLWRDASGGYWIEVVDGAVATSPVRVLAGGSGWEAVGHGDFNGDGKIDLLWRNGRVGGVWLLDGAAPASYGVLDDPDPAYFYRDARPLLTGDFDGDGKSDILWYRDSDSSVAVSLMDGLSATWKGTIHSGPTFWVPDMTADFNGDGTSDILWRCADGSYGVWLMSGATYSATTVIRAGNAGWRVLYARDLDGDGKADLVWARDDGSHEVWLMDGLAVKAVVPLNAGPAWYVAAADDYDGDGKTDLLWLNKSDPSIGTILTTSIAPPNYTLIAAPPVGWGPWQ